MTADEKKIKVVCVDDDIAGMALMRLLIEDQADMEVVGSFAHAVNLEAVIAEMKPDVLLLDLTLPGRDAVEALRGVVATLPATRVLVFSGRDEPELIQHVLSAGASGFIAKGVDSDHVIESIRKVMAGERPMVL